jgi:Arc/MetJ family transcription regulator
MTLVATNLDLDPALVEHALRVSGEKTKKAAVTKALEEFVARRERAKLADLIQSSEWDPDYDYKADRAYRDDKHQAMGMFDPEDR